MLKSLLAVKTFKLIHYNGMENITCIVSSFGHYKDYVEKHITYINNLFYETESIEPEDINAFTEDLRKEFVKVYMKPAAAISAMDDIDKKAKAFIIANCESDPFIRDKFNESVDEMLDRLFG